MRHIEIDFEHELNLDRNGKTKVQVFLTANVKFKDQYYVEEMFIDKVKPLFSNEEIDLETLTDEDRELILDKAYSFIEDELEELDEAFESSMTEEKRVIH